MSTQTPTTIRIRAAALRPLDVVTIPAGLVGAGARRVVSSMPRMRPGDTIIEVSSRATDGTGPAPVVLPADELVEVHRAITADPLPPAVAAARRAVIAEHLAALDAGAPDLIQGGIVRQVERAAAASGGSVVTCGEHGAYVRSFGGAISCTASRDACDLSWSDFAGHADGGTLAWHLDFLTVA